MRLEGCSAFQKKVLLEAATIPAGRVASYKWVRDKLGSGSPRAVGRALAKNPYPVVIPCHRVVRSSGIPGGFQDGPSAKKRLLESEGVRFTISGRVCREFFI